MLSFRDFLLTEHVRSSMKAIRVLNRIARMKKFGSGEVSGTLNTIIPRSDDSYAGTYYSPKRFSARRNKEFRPNTIDSKKFKHAGVTVTIPISKLKTAQDRIITKGVEYQLKNKVDSKPSVFYKDGKWVVKDGNHRITAARLRGKKNIKADVFLQREGAFSEVSQELAVKYIRKAVPRYDAYRQPKRKEGILRAIERLKAPEIRKYPRKK